MILGIDFDDTFTVDPPFFREIVKLAKAAGHTIVMVTLRSKEDREEIEDVTKCVMPIVFCSMLQGKLQKKRIAALRAGYDVDIWIDDSPEMI